MNALLAPRWRALLRISAATLRRRWLRAATTVIGTVGVVAMLTALLSIAQGYENVVRATAGGDNVLVLMEGADAELASHIPAAQVSLIRSSPHVARDADGRPRASAELFTTVKVRTRGAGDEMNVSLRGVEAAGPALRGLELTAGRRFATGRRELLIGRGARSRFAGLEIGDVLQVGDAPWRVVGEFRAASGVAESELWAEAGTLASALGRGEAVQAVYLQLAPGSRLAALRDAFDADPRLAVRAVRERDYLGEQADALRGFVRTLGFGIALLMGLGAAFAALGAGLASVNSRIAELGTLRALGFRDGTVFAAVLGESIALALFGALLGALATWLAFDGLQTSTLFFSRSYTQVVFAFDVTPSILALTAAAALAIGVLGGLYPAWQAARMPLAAALGDRR